ncbi:MAG: ion channel [Candidatus Micrarchaeia archaeon]
MHEKVFSEFVRQVQDRGVYFAARIIVLLLLGSILFFPEELVVALETPAILGILLFGTIVMVMVLLGDLLLTHQKSVSSLVYKYVFLIISVILAYGLFYYINATLLDPPGLHYWSSDIGKLEQTIFYFSGTTYFTIGYGDITPVGMNAQIAAVSEAFVGTMINLVVLAMAFQRWVWRASKENAKKV